MNRAVLVVALAACARSEGGVQKGDPTVAFFTPRPLSSLALRDAVAVRCTATPGAETPIPGPAGSKFPSGYQRALALSACTPIRGALAIAPGATLTGATELAPPQRHDDPRWPTLELDGQRLFDRPWQGAFDLVVVVGGPPFAAAMGANQLGAVLDGHPGAAVRGFALVGADASLELAALAGWRGAGPPPALDRMHPLVALDSLRVAIATGDLGEAARIAAWLLHPTEVKTVRALAIELLGATVAAAPDGPDAQRLAAVMLDGWEQEGFHARVDTAYLRACTAAAARLRSGPLAARARSVATTLDDRPALQSALKDALR